MIYRRRLRHRWDEYHELHRHPGSNSSGWLGKEGHKSPARETKQGCAIGKRVWNVRQPPRLLLLLLLSLPVSGGAKFAGILRGEFSREGSSSPECKHVLCGPWQSAERSCLREIYVEFSSNYILYYFIFQQKRKIQSGFEMQVLSLPSASHIPSLLQSLGRMETG